MLQGQEGPGPLPGHVDGAAVDDGVRPGKVDELKDAEALGDLAAVGLDAAKALPVRYHDLTGTEIPEEPGADGVQGAALRGEDHAAVPELPHAEGAEAVGVPDGDEL